MGLLKFLDAKVALTLPCEESLTLSVKGTRNWLTTIFGDRLPNNEWQSEDNNNQRTHVWHKSLSAWAVRRIAIKIENGKAILDPCAAW